MFVTNSFQINLSLWGVAGGSTFVVTLESPATKELIPEVESQRESLGGGGLCLYQLDQLEGLWLAGCIAVDLTGELSH